MTDRPDRVGFVSYAGDDDAAVVDRFVSGVMGPLGVDAMPAGRPAEQDFEARAHALAASDAVVVFVGRPTNSPWANFELGVAIGGERVVVPVYLSEEARRSAPGLLSAYAGIDAYDRDLEDVAKQIADVLRAAA